MSLKDELEKIIQSEQRKLEERDHKHADYLERQKNRFAPLRAVLQELIDSVEPFYFHAYLSDDSAMFDAGNINWRIQPNYRKHDTKLFYEEPGFRVEETVDTGHHTYTDTHVFENEQETASYLIRTVSKIIAHRQYLNKLAQLPTKEQPALDLPYRGL